jgi:hypothetical protein
MKYVYGPDLQECEARATSTTCRTKLGTRIQIPIKIKRRQGGLSGSSSACGLRCLIFVFPTAGMRINQARLP